MSDPIVLGGDDDSNEMLSLHMRVVNFTARAAADPSARHGHPAVNNTAPEPGMAHRPLTAEALVRLFHGVADLPVSRSSP